MFITAQEKPPEELRVMNPKLTPRPSTRLNVKTNLNPMNLKPGTDHFPTQSIPLQIEQKPLHQLLELLTDFHQMHEESTDGTSSSSSSTPLQTCSSPAAPS